ncbi:MAG TPA: Uma2 family endonuclease [Bryobacteraceae bacterium]|nr:Uma2 family endonuclease [Bryobacteraceae bacterium]
MSASTAIHIVTLEEFLRRPERADGQREELIEGEIVLSPEPKPLHAQIVGRLREALAPLKQQGFVIEGPFGCQLPNTLPGPDLGVMREERWQEAIQNDAYPEGSPDLVVEVRSPSNRQLGRKASLYLEHGAEAVWIINPKRRAIVVYDQDGIREIRENEQLDFHGVQVDVAAIFR